MSAEFSRETLTTDIDSLHEIALAEVPFREGIKIGPGIWNALTHPFLTMDRSALIKDANFSSDARANLIKRALSILQNPQVQRFQRRALGNLVGNDNIDEVLRLITAPAHEYYKFDAVSAEASAVMGIAGVINSGHPREMLRFAKEEYLADPIAARKKLGAIYTVCGMDESQRDQLDLWGDEFKAQATTTDLGVSLVEEYEPSYEGGTIVVPPSIVISHAWAHPSWVSLTVKPQQ